jgi:outer membrane immunogenic protein
MSMRRFALCLLSATALGTGCATAADLPARMPTKAPVAAPLAYNWSGFYFGGHVGGGWVDTDSTIVTNFGAAFPPGTVNNQSASGVIAGGQLGVNWQLGQWVLGVEGDYSWSGIDGDNSHASVITPGTVSHTHSEINWLATATARVGYAWDNWLFYVKGGGAWADFDSNSYTTNAGGTTISTLVGGETRSGWTVGAGLEWSLLQNWSAKLEYNYLDFGTDRETRLFTSGANAGSTVLRDVDTHIHVVKVGLNYRFNWGPPVGGY